MNFGFIALCQTVSVSPTMTFEHHHLFDVIFAASSAAVIFIGTRCSVSIDGATLEDYRLTAVVLHQPGCGLTVI